jgi:hypothetical protein
LRRAFFFDQLSTTLLADLPPTQQSGKVWEALLRLPLTHEAPSLPTEADSTDRSSFMNTFTGMVQNLLRVKIERDEERSKTPNARPEKSLPCAVAHLAMHGGNLTFILRKIDKS